MDMLYESDSFVVMHMSPGMAEPDPDGISPNDEASPRLLRHGFEIVDKRSGKEIYLDGSWAEMFHQQIMLWQRETPTQQEVEDFLDRYASLAQNPVFVH